MRVHFQQLTEPIAPLVDNYRHELFAIHLSHSTFQNPTQLRSPATPPRRLHESPTTPRACGDPISSPSAITA